MVISKDTEAAGPNERTGSYRQILRASSLLGGASVLNVVIGLGRVKVAALLLGPVGVGQIGLYQNLLVVAASLASLGIGTVGARQIAAAAGDGDATGIAHARRALFLATLLCAILGTLAVGLLARPLAHWVLGDVGQASMMMLLALGVGLTVLTAYQTAVLTGLRRIGDVARLSILSGFASTALAIAALFLLHSDGIIIFVLTTPLVSAALGWLMLRRMPAARSARMTRPDLGKRLYDLATLGIAFTIAGAAINIGQLAARTIVQSELGPVALGQFQAAWYISITYLAFILQAMSTDFYPRLTAAIDRPSEAVRIVNEQTEVALGLGAPVLIGLIGAAPWAMQILYAREFAQGAAILQWQILGDVLKLAAWPLGFLMLATNSGRAYLLTECIGVAVFVASIWLGVAFLGVEASGIAVPVMYLVYLPLVWLIAKKRFGFRWSGLSCRLLVRLVLFVGVTIAVSRYDAVLGLIVGSGLAAATTWLAVRQIHHAMPAGLQRLFRARS